MTDSRETVRPRRRIRDRAAFVCLCTGALGLICTAFAWQWLAGMAAVCVLLIVVGVYAGLE